MIAILSVILDGQATVLQGSNQEEVLAIVTPSLKSMMYRRLVVNDRDLLDDVQEQLWERDISTRPTFDET